MKKILFPTDFSEHANNALDFAVRIANALKSELLILHTYRTPLDYHIPADMIDQMAEDEHKTVTRILKKSVANYFGQNPEFENQVKISPLAVQGFTSDIIVKSAENYDVDLIVMGTKGATGLEKIFLGSMTTTVIEQAILPTKGPHVESSASCTTKTDFAKDQK